MPSKEHHADAEEQNVEEEEEHADMKPRDFKSHGTQHQEEEEEKEKTKTLADCIDSNFGSNLAIHL
jgi:hypothetical protein